MIVDVAWLSGVPPEDGGLSVGGLGFVSKYLIYVLYEDCH
jgi:hypothetical protein